MSAQHCRFLFLCGLAAAAQKRCIDGPSTVVNNEDGIAALLLDKRLAMARGRHITSFIAGMVASFLPSLMLFLDSVVLSAVPSPTLDAFTSLLSKALPAVRCSKLLFRSSRDGATAAAFHSRCDYEGPTLTLIKDTNGNVFGGYTAVVWGSYDGWDYLTNRTAFLLTVVNPHADPPAVFPPKVYGYKFYCTSSCGPVFGDLFVTGEFDRMCSSNIGNRSYVNATRHSDDTVLTGAFYFTPVEVEVWGME
jgi:hypothetical protein